MAHTPFPPCPPPIRFIVGAETGYDVDAALTGRRITSTPRADRSRHRGGEDVAITFGGVVGERSDDGRNVIRRNRAVD